MTNVVQSSYSERQPVAVAGMIANMRNWDGITRSNETDAGIGFGLAVSRGTDTEKGCKLAGAIADFLGVSMRDVTLEVTQDDEYADNQNVGILTMGEIWVQVTGTPGPDDPVHFDATTGVFAASGGTGPVLGARWMTETVSGLCRLKLGDYPQAAA